MASIPHMMNGPKKIFGGLPAVFLSGAAVFLLCMGPWWAHPAFAEQVLQYRTYHPDTGEELNRFSVTLRRNPSSGYQVKWVIEGGGSVTEEDYTLDDDWRTLRFRVVNDEERTDYVGERRGNMLMLRGRFKGESVQKDLTLDERPFYYNPKVGLAGFVRSGRKQQRFWGFQNRELEAYPMKAVRKGVEPVLVGGRKSEAVKVHWTVDDFRSMFFKRVYWFRPSDGLYLKQPSADGTFRELVSEQGEP